MIARCLRCLRQEAWAEEVPRLLADVMMCHALLTLQIMLCGLGRQREEKQNTNSQGTGALYRSSASSACLERRLSVTLGVLPAGVTAHIVTGPIWSFCPRAFCHMGATGNLMLCSFVNFVLDCLLVECFTALTARC